VITLPPLYRWALRSKLVFLAFGAGLLFLFTNVSSEFSSETTLNGESGVVGWEKQSVHRVGIPALVQREERVGGGPKVPSGGSEKGATVEVDGSWRIIWASLAWLYPLTFAVLFCVREWWLLREARSAKSAEITNTS
jgi:hypothetical protein